MVDYSKRIVSESFISDQSNATTFILPDGIYHPHRIAENHAVMVNNFTSYLLNTANLINNALASNMRVYNTALEQTRDNLKAFAKTNRNCIKAVEQSVNRHNQM